MDVSRRGKVLAKVALARSTALSVDHITDIGNPHSVTKTQVGLGNVDNTSDLDKPISDAVQDELDDINALIANPVAYCCYAVAPALVLTTTFQKVTGWTPLVTPVNVTEVSGTFTAVVDGIYEWHFERIYQNTDKNPIGIINLYLEVRLNGVTVFSRTAPTMSATANDEPAINTFNSPFILEVAANDYFEFYVKADDAGGNPLDTQLIQMQITADKIHNIPVV